MKELFKTTFKNGLTAVVSFDAENLDYSYVVTYDLVSDNLLLDNPLKTNSATAAFSMLAVVQRLVVE